MPSALPEETETRGYRKPQWGRREQRAGPRLEGRREGMAWQWLRRIGQRSLARADRPNGAEVIKRDVRESEGSTGERTHRAILSREKRIAESQCTEYLLSDIAPGG